MIKSIELKSKLEAMMDILTDNYTPAHWDAKNEMDVACYHVSKKVYEEADDAICSCDVDWDDGDYMEDYDTISQIINSLGCYIDMMEEDLNIY